MISFYMGLYMLIIQTYILFGITILEHVIDFDIWIMSHQLCDWNYFISRLVVVPFLIIFDTENSLW